MKLIEELVSRKIWCVIICLFSAFIISVIGTTTGECNDFGLRNIIDDEADWIFYKFTDQPCLICLDGRRMSSFNASLILPCRHQDQPEGSKVSVTYRVRINQTDASLTALGTNEQCEADNLRARGLTGEPVLLDEPFLGRGDSIVRFVRTFVPRQGHLLKPSIDFPEQSAICIERVGYENVRFANDTTIGTTTTRTPTTATKLTTSSTSPDSMTQTLSTSSKKHDEDNNSREERTFTTFGMTSEESTDGDSGAQEGSASPIWWIFLIFPVVIVGLVALVLFGICRRENFKRTSNPKSEEKDNMYKDGIPNHSDQNEDRESSQEGTIYNPVYGDNEGNNFEEKAANGLQSVATDVDYGEMEKWESTDGEMIYNPAYDGLAVKRGDALPSDAAYVSISEISSRKKCSDNRSHKTEQNSQEVVENKNRNPSKKSTLKDNMVVYEAVEEIDTENKDRESKVEMIYNSAYGDIPTNEMEEVKRDGDYSVVDG